MTLLLHIKEKLQNIDNYAVVKKLGYHLAQKGLTILDKLLKTKHLHEWLKASHYDLLHTSESFLNALCKTIEIDQSFYDAEVSQAKRFNEKLKKLETLHIYVDTEFVRNNQPIFALAALSGLRYVEIQDLTQFIDKSTDETLAIVSNLITQHYHKSNGTLQLWGEIKRYVLHLYEKKYVFDINGKLIEYPKEIFESVAILCLK